MKTALLAAAFLCTAAAAWAQGGRKVSFRIVCPEPLPGLTQVWLPAAKARDPRVAVPIYAASISRVVEATFKGDEAVLFTAADQAQPAVRGKLAKSQRQLLLLLPAAAGAYEIRAFDDDTDTFKPGGVRAINLSSATVRFHLGGEAMEPLAPSAHAVYPPPQKPDEFGMYPVVAETRGEDDAWNKIYSASWKTSGRRREIAFVQYDGKFKQWTVRLMTDDVPWLQDR